MGSALCNLIWLAHVPCTGSPCNTQSVQDITQIALKEAEALTSASVVSTPSPPLPNLAPFETQSYLYDPLNSSLQDAILLENMHDRPWQRPEQLGPESTASMAVVCSAVRQAYPGLPLGVQILAGGNKQALAVAKASGKLNPW